jgi:hypothetical protein
VYKEGSSVVIPTGIRLQPVGEAQFAEYKSQLAGITQDNAGEITAKLIELGMQPHAGLQVKESDVTMRETHDPELKRLREVAVALLGKDKGDQLANLVGEISGQAAAGCALGPAPKWAQQMADKRNLLKWDHSQYVGYLGINDRLVCCIVDTGAHRTIIDSAMARELGLAVKTDGI